MFTFGAGVTRPLNDLWSLIVQGDYRRFFEEGGGANAFRVFVGARRKLGT